MDSVGIPTPRLTRARKRAAEEQKQMEDRKRRCFRTRLIPSAKNSGDRSILIGPNDIITDPKNRHKILVPQDTEEKPEMKEEEVLSVEEMEKRSRISFQEEEEPVSIKEEINSEVELDGAEENRLMNIVMESEVALASIVKVGVQTECLRCPDLEQQIEEKDLRIRGLEEELESQKQSNHELLKKLEEAISEASKAKAGGEKRSGMDQNENSNKTVKKDRHPIFNAISSGKSKEEIEPLVLEMGKGWKQLNEKGNTVLHVAARAGNLEALKYFISLGADVNARNSSGSTPLMKAAKVKKNFSEMADLLISKGADLLEINNSRKTALCIALENRKTLEDIDKLCFTLRKGNKISWWKCTAAYLNRAAECGDLETLKYYMSLKPDVNAKNSFGMTPLWSALKAKKDVLPVVDLLLTNGADIKGWDAVDAAIQTKKSVPLIEKFVDAGASWNKVSALLRCIQIGHLEALKYFIGKGAHVNGKDSSGCTPLLRAVCEEKPEAVKILIENGATPLRGTHLSYSTVKSEIAWRAEPVKSLQALSKHGVTWCDTILHCFVDQRKLEALRCCVYKGANVNIRHPDDGSTPLVRSALAKGKCPSLGIYGFLGGQREDFNEGPSLEILDFLVGQGANVNEVDKEGFSILHRATKGNSSWSSLTTLTVVKKLVSLGATWTSGVVGKGIRKESILHAAVRGDRPEVLHYFASEGGVDVNAKNSEGDTPFLLTVRLGKRGMTSILRTLVNGGADPNARDIQGNTALLIGVCSPLFNCELLTDYRMKLLIELGCNWRLPNNEGLTVIAKLAKNTNSVNRLAFFKNLG